LSAVQLFWSCSGIVASIVSRCWRLILVRISRDGRSRAKDSIGQVGIDRLFDFWKCCRIRYTFSNVHQNLVQ
uniref:Secreted protein n=1 Tax=Haemonchus placei TaxID=6290 RepID=A0A0N4WUQ1_HAEPC